MGYKQPSSGLPFKEMGSSPAKNGKKTMHPMEAIKQVDPGYMDKSYEKDINKSKLRGDYQDHDEQLCEHYGINYEQVNCIEALY